MGGTLDQLIPTATTHDAVTEQALAWQEVLARHGYTGSVYAENIDPLLRRTVRPLRQFSPRSTGAVLIHYAIASGIEDRVARVPRDRLGIVYHNITPGHFLETTNPLVAALCVRGRARLRGLADRARVVVADSSFNAQELMELGFGEVHVVPLLLRLSHPTATRRAPEPEPEPEILTVGRIVPNKRIEDTIRGVALLRRHLMPDARLIVLGSGAGFELYQEALQRLTHALGMNGVVTFTGAVADDERDAAYARAGAYVCMSEHEGFCAPLVEALARGLTVVARSSTAIPETLGGAGMLVPDGDPIVLAECLHEALTNAPLRDELSRRGARRVAELDPAVVERRFLEAIQPLLAVA